MPAESVGGRRKRAEKSESRFREKERRRKLSGGIYSPESVNGLSYTIRKALDFEAADPPDYFAFFHGGYAGAFGG